MNLHIDIKSDTTNSSYMVNSYMMCFWELFNYFINNILKNKEKIDFSVLNIYSCMIGWSGLIHLKFVFYKKSIENLGKLVYRIKYEHWN